MSLRSFRDLLVLSSFSAMVGLAQVPPRSEAGQTLVVPDAHLELGDVYHVWPGGDSQILMRAYAPLQAWTISTSRVVGYVSVPFDMEESESPVLAGAFRIPSASLTTGLRGGDGMLHGPSALDVRKHPEMTFEVTSFSDVERIGGSDDAPVFRGTLAGKASLKGSERELSFPVSVALTPFATFGSRDPAVGDRLVIRGSFTLPLTEYGWKPPSPRMAGRFPETLEVDVFLMLGNASPDVSGDPRKDVALHHKELRFLTLLRDLNDPVAGYAWGRRLLREYAEDADVLARLAQIVLRQHGIKRRDPAFALKAAVAAARLQKEADPNTLALIARAHYLRGDIDLALSWQEKAVAAGEGLRPRAKAGLQAALEGYRKELPQDPQTSR